MKLTVSSPFTPDRSCSAVTCHSPLSVFWMVMRGSLSFMGRSFLFGMLLRDLHSSTGLDRPARFPLVPVGLMGMRCLRGFLFGCFDAVVHDCSVFFLPVRGLSERFRITKFFLEPL